MGRKSKYIFLQIRHINAKRYKKRCSVSLIVIEMQVKLQWGITSSSQNGHLKKKNLQTINAREGVERMKPSCTVGENVNWYSHCGDQYGDSLINQK